MLNAPKWNSWFVSESIGVRAQPGGAPGVVDRSEQRASCSPPLCWIAGGDGGSQPGRISRITGGNSKPGDLRAVPRNPQLKDLRHRSDPGVLRYILLLPTTTSPAIFVRSGQFRRPPGIPARAWAMQAEDQSAPVFQADALAAQTPGILQPLAEASPLIAEGKNHSSPLPSTSQQALYGVRRCEQFWRNS